MPAVVIGRIAAELAHTAFEEAIAIERPWTDIRGERHPRMIGRPVAFHAMRGALRPFKRLDLFVRRKKQLYCGWCAE